MELFRTQCTPHQVNYQVNYVAGYIPEYDISNDVVDSAASGSAFMSYAMCAAVKKRVCQMHHSYQSINAFYAKQTSP